MKRYGTTTTYVGRQWVERGTAILTEFPDSTGHSKDTLTDVSSLRQFLRQSKTVELWLVFSRRRPPMLGGWWLGRTNVAPWGPALAKRKYT